MITLAVVGLPGIPAIILPTLPASLGVAAVLVAFGVAAVLVAFLAFFVAALDFVEYMQVVPVSGKEKQTARWLKCSRLTGSFLSSLGMAATIELASFGVFFTWFLASIVLGAYVQDWQTARWLAPASVIIGLVPGLVVAVWLFWKFFAKQR